MIQIVPRVIALTLTVLCHAVRAADPPDIVYRVDSRPPEEVFVHGFQAWGNDHNIVAHVNGHTCTGNTRTSAFISTMTNYNMVNALAENHLMERLVTYIYSIRADSNFYDAAASVAYYQCYRPSSPLSISSIANSRRVREWAAVRRILPENIHSVQIRHRDGHTTIQLNVMYDDQATRGNPDIYTEYAAETLQHYRFPLELPDNSTTWASACFNSCLPQMSSYSNLVPRISLVNEQCVYPNVFRIESALAFLFQTIHRLRVDQQAGG
jgi:hypothetical protein